MRVIATMFAASLLLAGCEGSADNHAATSSHSVPAEVGAQAKEQADQVHRSGDDFVKTDAQVSATVEIVIRDGSAMPRGKRIDVKVGQKVILHVIGDAPEVIHVHSDPEHVFEVVPGDDRTFTFTVDVPGQVAVEAHHADAAIVQLVVRP